MLEKTKNALKEELGNSSNLTCDPIPAPVIGVVKIAKALKEDLQDISKKESSTKKIVNEREERI